GDRVQHCRYLVTAPSSFRVDAVETVFVQLFGYTREVTVFVFLKDSMAPNHKLLSRDVLTLNANNKFQALANVQVRNSLDIQKVVLHVQSDEINNHVFVPISRSNGFMFIQTDKPLYTPHQNVKVRAFSMNQELRPANRSVFLTFKVMVSMIKMVDINNGIPTMQKRFKIPIKPKLGIWTIEASYSDDFTTTAVTDFEVKEYVLPSIDINVQPSLNFISDTNFNSFDFKISARYVHGAPVADGEVFLRYGYVSGKNAPFIIPNLVKRERVRKDKPLCLSKDFCLMRILFNPTGGINQEAEFASVKFLKSPYHLSLISTPPFIKPGLPYNIKVCAECPNRCPMVVALSILFTHSGVTEGLVSAVLHCLTSPVWLKQFQTAGLAEANRATLTLESVAYHSPNQRYLYINTPMFGKITGNFFTAAHSQVLSKGKVVFHKSVDFVRSLDGTNSLNFMVTPSMVPSIRLLVFYILHGEGTSELVADSVWIDVKHKCINGLEVKQSSGVYTRIHKPKENLNIDIRANQPGLVALSAVDSAVYSIRRNYKDPISMVLRHIEQSDLGCGGGGGKDNADVFRLAGLTFLTNANAQSTSVALSDEAKEAKGNSLVHLTSMPYTKGHFRASTVWEYFGPSYKKLTHRCREAFRECCEFYQKNKDDGDLILAHIGVNFDEVPQVRSYFPESWLWEVQPISSGKLSVSGKLPDSLTTWEIQAVGMFPSGGMCVADTAKVSVNLPLSVDIPLPYQVVRGEQVVLQGSVYNHRTEHLVREFFSLS
uniref:Anaphylatoxin-like domain-containing protein n=1 Tax=Oryzias latipes TaxID=8090 RepID=A0A3P9KV19_ORYLA